MFENTQHMLLRAATNGDAKNVAQTMSTFLNASYRDAVKSAEAVSRIWRRFSREVSPGLRQCRFPRIRLLPAETRSAVHFIENGRLTGIGARGDDPGPMSPAMATLSDDPVVGLPAIVI